MPNSRLKEAFVQSPNLIGMAAIAAVSLGELSLVPLIAGAAVEAAYLLFAPDTRWIRDKVAKQREAEEQNRRADEREQLLAGVRPDVRERFARLSERREEIERAVQGNPAWYNEELEHNLDYLLDKFLLFANKEAQCRAYLESVRAESGDRQGGRAALRPNGTGKPRSGDDVVDWSDGVVAEVGGRYRAEQEKMRQEAAAETDGDAQLLLDKRIQVLARRLEYLEQSGRTLTNIHRQLTLLEDAFGLINDEIRARPPEQVVADLEGVLSTTQAMTDTLNEMAELEQTLTQ